MYIANGDFLYWYMLNVMKVTLYLILYHVMMILVISLNSIILVCIPDDMYCHCTIAVQCLNAFLQYWHLLFEYKWDIWSMWFPFFKSIPHVHLQNFIPFWFIMCTMKIILCDTLLYWTVLYPVICKMLNANKMCLKCCSYLIKYMHQLHIQHYIFSNH